MRAAPVSIDLLPSIPGVQHFAAAWKNRVRGRFGAVPATFIGKEDLIEEMGGQEKSRILEALEKSLYIKADAARMLRMSRTTLLGKMKRYQIPG